MQAFEPHYCGQSQVHRIFCELAQGLARIDELEERSERTHDAIELISQARRTYREELKGTGRPYNDNAYNLPKAEFLAYLEQYDHAKQGLLRERYDRLWLHYKLTDAIQLGQAKAGPARDDARCFAEEIEPLAHEYLALRGVESKTLEWLLMCLSARWC
ncbi:hypothetical protein ACFJIX_04030 [Roseateles sp. UC29_93]|uniref:hypothetical protein n=1 Tax=Roseateles sp. UC29_93 TaxID=3350177 RepID=UPI00366A9C86